MMLQIVVLAAGLALGASRPGELPKGILGIQLGMKEEAAHRRLERLGMRQVETGESESEEEKGDARGREIWVLKDTRIRYLALAFDRHERVLWVQAFARPGGPPIPYRAIGDPAAAKKLGYTIYQWRTPAAHGQPARVVEASGSDSLVLSNWSIRAVPDRDYAPSRSRNTRARARLTGTSVRASSLSWSR